MANIYIDVLNASTEAKDQIIIWLTAALQKQVSRDFAPAWGIDATLIFIPSGMTANPNHWQLVFLDNADQAGALGYHDLTPRGLPLGKVFIRTTEQAGDAWSVTASHELLEMLGDPYANTSVLMLNQDGVSGTCFAYEVCDAVEDDSLGYAINDFKVSDFVYPNWFEPAGTTPAGSKYDFCGRCTGPFQLLKNGYIGAFSVPNTQGWAQLYPNGMVDPSAPTGSRREFRQKPHVNRKKSTAKRCGA